MRHPVLILLALAACDLDRLPAPATADGAAAIDAAVDAVVDAPRPVVDAHTPDASIDGPVASVFVPADVPPGLRSGHVVYSLPPQGWSSAVAWLHTIYDQRYAPAPSSVQVDWMRLYAVVNGGASVQLVGETAPHPSSVAWADTYARSPWFGQPYAPAGIALGGDIVTATPDADVARLIILGTDRVPSGTIPAAATHLRLEARIRITGHAIAQAGIDFWVDGGAPPNGANNRLGGVTDWLGESGQWQVIILDLAP